MNETDFQISVVNLLTFILPPSVFFFHVPNGGDRTRAEAAIFKGMGVKAGVADLVLVHQGRAYFLELKAPGKPAKLSAQQDEVAEDLQKAGAKTICANSLKSVIAALDLWLIPHKEVDIA